MVELVGVSYYHAKIPDHAAADFCELADAGLDAIVLAASEDDCYHWFPNMIRIAEAAKDVGLYVYWDFWGWGHVFGGEPSSRFLDYHHDRRQVSAPKDRPVAAACFQDPLFSEYLLGWIRRVISQVPIDGFLIDEPHYYFPLPEGGWACRCPACQNSFQERYGKPMSSSLTDEVRAFREGQLLGFLESILSSIKSLDSSKRTAVVVLPSGDESPSLAQVETVRDWERLASLPNLDVFATDPYCHAFGLPTSWAEAVAQRTVQMARKHGKRSQLWVQLFALPMGAGKEVASLIRRFNEFGADEILAWTYRAAEGTTLSCARPRRAWQAALKAFREIKQTS